MQRIRRLFFRFFGLAFFVWAIVCAALVVMRHDLIYPFRDWVDAHQVSGVPGAVAETFVAADGTDVIAWIVQPRPGHRTILYFMGNAGSLPSAAPRLTELATAGFGIVALNYRGAGGAPGEPRQEALTGDAVALYDRHATDGRLPVIYGTSLGAAVAAQLAARRPAAAVILETPFARLCETAQYYYPYVPACLILPDQHWDSIEAVQQIEAPVLILHGDADQVIPMAHGKKLFEAAAEPKEMKIFEGGRHNDLRLFGATAEIIGFIERHAP